MERKRADANFFSIAELRVDAVRLNLIYQRGLLRRRLNHKNAGSILVAKGGSVQWTAPVNRAQLMATPVSAGVKRRELQQRGDDSASAGQSQGDTTEEDEVAAREAAASAENVAGRLLNRARPCIRSKR